MNESDPWDEHAAGWDDDPDARAYAAAAFESLLAVLDDRRVSLAGARVCDFGCGTGLLTERMVSEVQSIDAVDTSAAMLAQISAKIQEHGWDNVRLSTTLPKSLATHDLVVCSSVLSFVDDYPRAVKRLSGLLAPDGMFLQWDWERNPADVDAHGLGRDEIRDALVGAGLVVLCIDKAFEITMDGARAQPVMGVGKKANAHGG